MAAKAAAMFSLPSTIALYVMRLCPDISGKEAAIATISEHMGVC